MRFGFYIMIFISSLGLVLPSASHAQNQRYLTVKVYFSDTGTVASDDCSAVLAVPRKIVKTKQTAKAVLNELFKGPTTEEEKRYNISSPFSAQSKDLLNKVIIRNGIAYVDLKAPFHKYVSGPVGTSCGSAAFQSSLYSTLGQFPTIKKMYFSIGGKYEAFYGLAGGECPEELKQCDNSKI